MWLSQPLLRLRREWEGKKKKSCAVISKEKNGQRGALGTSRYTRLVCINTAKDTDSLQNMKDKTSEDHLKLLCETASIVALELTPKTNHNASYSIMLIQSLPPFVRPMLVQLKK